LAEKQFQKAIILSPENEKYWSKMLDHIQYVRNGETNHVELGKFTGSYWGNGSDLTFETIIHNGYLFRKAGNQMGAFFYPTSDTTFAGNFGNLHFSYVSSSKGTIVKLINHYDYPNSTITYDIWKNDSLIQSAERFLLANQYGEALSAFKAAYAENPDHYYLPFYIRHLEFIQSKEYAISKTELDSVVGSYSNASVLVKLFKERDNFYIRFPNANEFKVLPLSSKEFMLPFWIGLHFEIMTEGDQVKGVVFVTEDEERFYMEKLSG